MASMANSAHFLSLVQVLCLLLWIIPHAAGPIAVRNITSDGLLTSVERLVDGDLSLNKSLDEHCVRFTYPNHTYTVSFSVRYFVEKIQLLLQTDTLRSLRGAVQFWSESEIDGQWYIKYRQRYLDVSPSRPFTVHLTGGAITTAMRVGIVVLSGFHSLALCEITAIGHRFIPCDSTHCLTGDCNSATGCSNCTAGKRLPGCIEDCEPGTFGESCASVCGRCEADAVCHRQTGSCPRSCPMWFSGERCDVTIAKAHFSEEIAIASPLNTTCVEVLWQPIRNISDELAGFYGYHVTLHDSVTTLRDEAFVAHDNSAYMLRVVLCGLEAEVGRQVIIEPYRKWSDGSRDPGQAYPKMDLYTEHQSDFNVIVLAVILTMVMTLALTLSVGCVITCRRHGGIKQTFVCRHDDATPVGARQPEAIYANVAGPGQSTTDQGATCRTAVKASEETHKGAYEPFNLETREVPAPADTVYEDIKP